MSPRDTFTAEVPKVIQEDDGYLQWEESLDGSLFIRVEAAREMIQNNGIVTNVKDLGDGLYEKKWVSGLRLYFSVIENNGRRTLLLLGSGKGKDQTRAIQRSKIILTGYQEIRESILKRD